MRLVVCLFVLGWMYLGFGSVLNAQISQPLIPLQLQGEPRPTQIPPYSTLATPQCDGSGDVYLRYAAQTDNSQPTMLASIEPDGSTQTISLTAEKGSEGDSHVFLFAAGNDGSLHEILRASDPSDQEQSSTDIQYATFGADGALHSQAAFEQEFIPSLLLPLPDGSFFASGVTLKDTQGEVSESPLVGIFNSDATMVRHLKRDSPALVNTSSGDSGGEEDESGAAFDGGVAKLGGDGNIYVLLPGDHAKVAVVTQTGQIARELKLQEPFEADIAHDMWISGNRILIVYEGEADDPKGAYLYVVYDAQTGDVIRVYRPDFSGTVACFQDGQTVSVLVRQPSSGKVALGTAELR